MIKAPCWDFFSPPFCLLLNVMSGWPTHQVVIIKPSSQQTLATVSYMAGWGAIWPLWNILCCSWGDGKIAAGAEPSLREWTRSGESVCLFRGLRWQQRRRWLVHEAHLFLNYVQCAALYPSVYACAPCPPISGVTHSTNSSKQPNIGLFW